MWKCRELKWAVEDLFEDNTASYSKPKYSPEQEEEKREKARKEVIQKIVLGHRRLLIKSLNHNYTKADIGYVDNKGVAHFDQFYDERDLLANAIANLSKEEPKRNARKKTQKTFPKATETVVKSITRKANKSYGHMAGISYEGEYLENDDPFLQTAKQVGAKQRLNPRY